MLRFVAAFGSEEPPVISFPSISEGQDKKLEFTASRIPLGDSVVSLLLVGKLLEDDPDSEAVFNKVVTATDQAGVGFLLNSGVNGVAGGFIVMTRSETSLFPVGLIPFVTGWVRLQSGLVAPCGTGTMQITEPGIIDVPTSDIDSVTVTVS